VGLEPACSKACPTDSIQFGSIVELRTRAHKRVDQLKAQGVKAELYGADPDGALGGSNSFYLLVDEPEVYGLPRKPALPSRNLAKSASFSFASAAVLGVLALVGLRKRRMDAEWAARGEEAPANVRHVLQRRAHWTVVHHPVFLRGRARGWRLFPRRGAGLVRPPEDRPVVRTGYDIAAWARSSPACSLTIDLGRPRCASGTCMFQSENFPALMVSSGWSPISFGAWAILLFGLLSVLSALGARTEEGRLQMPALRAVGGLVKGGVAKLVGGAGGLLGLFIAGYTGILLSVTNRPSGRTARGWGRCSSRRGLSTGAAALILLSHGARSNGALSRVAVVVRHQGARSRAARADRLHRVAGLGQPGLGKASGGCLLLVGRRLVRDPGPAPHARAAPAASHRRQAGARRRVPVTAHTILASEAIDRYRVAAGL